MLKHAKNQHLPVNFRSQLRPGLRRNQRHKSYCEEIFTTHMENRITSNN